MTAGRRIAVVVVTLLGVLLSATAVHLVRGGSEVDYRACSGADTEDCVVDTAVEHASQVGVAEALGTLELVVRSRPDLLNGCHVLTHEVGKAFHERFDRDAIVKASTWCSYGYLHGVMTSMGYDNPTMLTDSVLELCTDMEGTLTTGCVHGLGHASYAVNGSVDAAMPSCEGVTERELRSTCSQAVLMEVAFDQPDGQLPPQYDSSTCLGFTDDGVVGGCALFIASADVVRGLDLSAACDGYLTDTTLHDCRYGYGSGLATSHLGGLRSEQAPSQRSQCAGVDSCAQGFGMASMLYIGDRDGAEELCIEMLGPDSLEACRLGIGRADSLS